MKKRVTKVTVRLPQWLGERLEQYADQTFRSLNGAVCALVEAGLDTAAERQRLAARIAVDAEGTASGSSRPSC